MSLNAIKNVLHNFPKSKLICGYGSAFFNQPNQKPTENNQDKMLDFIITTKDARKWHQENMLKNPLHYTAFMKTLGAKNMTKLQNFGDGVYFNTGCEIDGLNVKIKYGVIQENKLLHDLKFWKRMYVAGRFQKPVEILKSPPNFSLNIDNNSTPLNTAFHKNRKMALSAALLHVITANYKNINIEDIFKLIASHSYAGDVRTFFAEDVNKITSIVKGSMDLFQDIYKPHFHALKRCLPANIELIYQEGRICHVLTKNDAILFDYLTNDLANIFSKNHFFARFKASMGISFVFSDDMNHVLKSRVFKSSISQALKCTITVNPFTSLYYFIRKLKKFSKSRKTV